MTSFWGGVKSFFLDLVEDVPLDQQVIVRWGTIEGRIMEVIDLLKPQNNRPEYKQAAHILSEIMCVFDKSKIQSTDNDQFNLIRDRLLILWQILLEHAKRYSLIRKKFESFSPHVQTNDITPMDVEIYHKTIGFLMARREFRIELFKFDKSNRAAIQPGVNPDLEFKIAQRYRNLLCQTQEYAQNMLSAQVKGDIYATYTFQEFLAKVFAVTSFRLPRVSPIIQSAIQFTEEQTLELDAFLSDKKYKLPLRNPFDVPSVSQPSTSSKSSESSPKTVPVSQSNQNQSPQKQESENNVNEGESSNPTQNLPASTEKEASPAEGDKSTEQTSPQEASEAPSTSETAVKEESQAPASSDPPSDSQIEQASDPSAAPSQIKEESKEQNKEEAAAAALAPTDPPKEPAATVKDVSIPAPIPSAPTSPSAKRLLFMADKFPNLFKWSNFHSSLLYMSKSDTNEEEKVSAGPWVEEFKKRENFFLLFLDQWVKHIKLVAEDDFKLIDWNFCKGYNVYIPIFLDFMRNSQNLIKDLQNCSCSLLLTDSSLLNYYLFHSYSRTSVFNVFDTLNTITLTEMWLKYAVENQLTLAGEFNHEFFCKAVDIMFHSDHHQIMTRALAMLYAGLDCFYGEARMNLLINCLLHKYFFHLFLHWDSSVRNCYHQLLLFKALRYKRSQLQQNIMNNEDPELITDRLILGKIESYLFMLDDQIKAGPNGRKDYPVNLEIYVPRAIDEYTSYKRFFHHWERSEPTHTPKLIPHSLLPSEFRKRNK